MYLIQDTLHEIGTLFNNAPNLMQTIRKAIEENADLKKQAEAYIKEKAISLKNRLIEKAENINGVKVIRLLSPAAPDMVKDLAFMLRGELTEHFVFAAATTHQGKPMLTIMLSDDMVKEGKNASAIVREAAKLIQGGGGGQPHFAQAGGKNENQLPVALDKMIELSL